MVIHGFSGYVAEPSVKIGKKDWAHGHLMAIHKYLRQGLEFLSNLAGFWARQELAQPHDKKSHMLNVGYVVDGKRVNGFSVMAKISLHPTFRSFVRLMEI
ncbi:Hypothetical predicted protein [Prunus dulcis]|uniref:Uncharacterized protein n=1 Tax=Prunus dulcis TaxID=3755 RepID=A0A5E4FGB7_PRUDU|nr:Hypothetical predicted protein [Prunus dulcis]